MAEYTPTPEQVEAFKRAWHEADVEGDAAADHPLVAEARSKAMEAAERVLVLGSVGLPQAIEEGP